MNDKKSGAEARLNVRVPVQLLNDFECCLAGQMTISGALRALMSGFVAGDFGIQVNAVKSPESTAALTSEELKCEEYLKGQES